MRARLLVAGLAATLAAGGVVTPGCTRSQPGSLPVVRVDFRAGSLPALLAEARRDPDAEAKVLFTDGERPAVPAKAARRGFSAWHHGDHKPSLRVEQPASCQPLRPHWVELSRPEDPLALGNWLPDQLGGTLGLLHAATTPVQLALDGEDLGVYLRSLRPGDDLAAAAGRARGTFWKGDAIGERQRLDLWRGGDAWRGSGATDARARARLDEVLQLLREPADADNLARLACAFDLAVAARGQALAVLTASIHADRAHNHVWFADPTKDQLEPLLWDANGFGLHAEPTLPVEVARHPLAERLLCDPGFVHARNETLWQLLGGAGQATALAERVQTHVADLTPTLAGDPEIARLVLQRGQFVVERVPFAALPQEVARFVAFVQARERVLREHFAGARVAVAPDPDTATQSRVTVFGTVAVRLSRDDGLPVLAADGRDAGLLWPGLSAALHPAPQHRAADGHGVAAPHARPAPLVYTVAAPAAALRFTNAFTGTVLVPETPPPATTTRSVHPWQQPLPPPHLTLGPGRVRLLTPLRLGPTTTLTIAAGTQLELAAGAFLHVRGPLRAEGTAAAPITLQAEAGPDAALTCARSDVRIAHFQARGPRPALLSLHGCEAQLVHCSLRGASGDGLVVAGGRTTLLASDVALCRGHALLAHAGAHLHADGSRFAFADHGVVVRDAATVHLRGGEIVGNMVGAFADSGGGTFAGGRLVLEGVVFRDTGRQDVVASGDGVVEQDADRRRTAPAPAGH